MEKNVTSKLHQEKIDFARKVIKNSAVTVENMYENRSEYSAKDLAWRLMDVSRALLKSFSALLDIVDPTEDIIVKQSGKVQHRPPTVSEMKDLLKLADLAKMPTKKAMEAWDEADRIAVIAWAGAIHADASDNDVELPPVPVVLEAYIKTASMIVKEKADESVEEPAFDDSEELYEEDEEDDFDDDFDDDDFDPGAPIDGQDEPV